MKAIQFDANLLKYISTMVMGCINKRLFYSALSCTTLKEIKEPELPNEDWVKIKTTYGGICGSDLNIIFLKDSPATSPFVSFPFVFGHEIVGEIEKVGSNVNTFSRSDRVVVNPILACKQRQIAEPCDNCKSGKTSLCENFAHGSLAPGISTGFCKDAMGSWGEYLVAHQSQMYKVPNHISDEEIIFTDPLASSLHPLLCNMPKDDERILIMGAGIIGVLMVAALRTIGNKCNITVLAKYNFQGEMAKRYGADHVVYTRDDYFEKFRKVSNGKLYQPIIGKKFMIGGFEKVFDCVGSSSTLDTAMRFTKSGGDMVVVGLAAIPKNVDWSAVWFKELNIRGSFYYHNQGAADQSDAFECAFKLICDKKIDLSPLLTHKFGINEYKQAIAIASNKAKHKSFKVVFKH